MLDFSVMFVQMNLLKNKKKGDDGYGTFKTIKDMGMLAV